MINFENFELDDLKTESNKVEDISLENTTDPVVENAEPVVEGAEVTDPEVVTKDGVVEESAEEKIKNNDEAGIAIPTTNKEINQSTYKAAISMLQNSFKEAVDVMAELSDAVIVEDAEFDEDVQDEFTENAIFESYADGPIFEAVKQEDKKEIKAIAKKLRKALTGQMRAIKWYTPKGKVVGNKLGLFDPMIIAKGSKDLKLVAWQTVCILIPKRGTTIGDGVKDVNEEFKDILGDYVAKAIKLKIKFIGHENLGEADPDDRTGLLKMFILIIDEKDAKEPKDLTINLNKAEVEKINKFMDQK